MENPALPNQLDRNKTCFFTGHRDIPRGDRIVLRRQICDRVIEAYEAGYRNFIAGGARGFDTMAALCVAGMRGTVLGEDLRLYLILPCQNQCRGWSEEDIAMRAESIRLSNGVDTLYPVHTKGCMMERNRAMADRSSRCIAYLRQENGGTAATVRYAKAQHIPIVYLSGNVLLNPFT